MSEVFTIDVELHRPGAPYGVLAKWVPYIALCQDEEPRTVWAPYDQHEFAERLKSLRYVDDTQANRKFFVNDISEKIGEMVEPVLAEALGAGKMSQARLIHLRVTSNVAEVQHLPFEAISYLPRRTPFKLPNGKCLLLTRRMRGAPIGNEMSWPEKPRLLFAHARSGLGGYGAIEEARHCETLKRWGDNVTILADASLVSTAKALESGDFTHLHILAHGHRTETRFELALHQATDAKKVDYISGERLVAGLFPGRLEKLPTVVVLASCDSANVNVPTVPGQSLAQEIHQRGVPLVIASQFPLSVAGAVRMTEVLHRGTFGREDPRLTLVTVRDDLRALADATHDWLSVVTYENIPGRVRRRLRGEGGASRRPASPGIDSALPAVHDEDVRQEQYRRARDRIAEITDFIRIDEWGDAFFETRYHGIRGRKIAQDGIRYDLAVRPYAMGSFPPSVSPAAWEWVARDHSPMADDIPAVIAPRGFSTTISGFVRCREESDAPVVVSCIGRNLFATSPQSSEDMGRPASDDPDTECSAVVVRFPTAKLELVVELPIAFKDATVNRFRRQPMAATSQITHDEGVISSKVARTEGGDPVWQVLYSISWPRVGCSYGLTWALPRLPSAVAEAHKRSRRLGGLLRGHRASLAATMVEALNGVLGGEIGGHVEIAVFVRALPNGLECIGGTFTEMVGKRLPFGLGAIGAVFRRDGRMILVKGEEAIELPARPQALGGPAGLEGMEVWPQAVSLTERAVRCTGFLAIPLLDPPDTSLFPMAALVLFVFEPGRAEDLELAVRKDGRESRAVAELSRAFDRAVVSYGA